MRTNKERLRRIQRKLDLEPDGVLGSDTLGALESVLGIEEQREAGDEAGLGLRFSRTGIRAIIDYEIGSKNYYQTRLRKPHWPGGESGVTIGIGYDLGYQGKEEFTRDWSALPPEAITRLSAHCGKKGKPAKKATAQVADISVSYAQAEKVFASTSLKKYAALTKSAFPGVEQLEPDAQSALLSLVFNRGASMRGDSRREMRAIKEGVRHGDYNRIAAELEAMKRLWEGRNLDGLLKRRDKEAAMVRGAQRDYSPAELVLV